MWSASDLRRTLDFSPAREKANTDQSRNSTFDAYQSLGFCGAAAGPPSIADPLSHRAGRCLWGHRNESSLCDSRVFPWAAWNYSLGSEYLRCVVPDILGVDHRYLGEVRRLHSESRPSGRRRNPGALGARLARETDEDPGDSRIVWSCAALLRR